MNNREPHMKHTLALLTALCFAPLAALAALLPIPTESSKL